MNTILNLEQIYDMRHIFFNNACNLVHILHIGERSTILRKSCAYIRIGERNTILRKSCANLAHILHIEEISTNLVHILRMKERSTIVRKSCTLGHKSILRKCCAYIVIGEISTFLPKPCAYLAHILRIGERNTILRKSCALRYGERSTIFRIY